MFRLLGYGLNLLSPFFVHLRHQLSLLLADDEPPGAPEKVTKKRKLDWKDILIILVIIFICVVAMLTLLGPTVDNYPTNVIMNL